MNTFAEHQPHKKMKGAEKRQRKKKLRCADVSPVKLALVKGTFCMEY